MVQTWMDPLFFLSPSLSASRWWSDQITIYMCTGDGIFNPQIMYVRWGTNYGYTIITRIKYALSTSAQKSQQTNMPVVRLVYVCVCVSWTCHLWLITRYTVESVDPFYFLWVTMVVELPLISVLVYVSAGVHYIVQLALHHLQIYAFVSETIGI